jgi:hypothetical protein
MAKAATDIETLKKWAAFVLASNGMHEEEHEAARAVLNLVAMVGTLKAQTEKLTARLVKNRAALVLAKEYIVGSEDHCRGPEFDVELLATIDAAIGST